MIHSLSPNSFRPDTRVSDKEFRRLLGYPPGQELEGAVVELAAKARRWYGGEGRPWIEGRFHEVEIVGADGFRLDGRTFRSKVLVQRLLAARADVVCVVAVSAGPEVSREATRLWQADLPDESYVLDTYGSAMVEHLRRIAGIQLCEHVEPGGGVVLPHYSPGYDGWDLTEQSGLFELLADELPGPLEVLPSGMLDPQKSTLAVFPVTRHRDLVTTNLAELSPCSTCSFSPCAYRRMPFKGVAAGAPRSAKAAPTPGMPSSLPRTPVVDPAVGRSSRPAPASYAFPGKALERWSREHLSLEKRPDGTIGARFEYNGSTCSNMGLPLKLIFEVELEPAPWGHLIKSMTCRPDANDKNHRAMCAYQQDGEKFLAEVAADRPRLGSSFEQILEWQPDVMPSGCICASGDRQHKWRIVMQTIHYGMSRS